MAPNSRQGTPCVQFLDSNLAEFKMWYLLFDLLFLWGMPPETPNPNDTEHKIKEKKKFNFFSKNWVSQSMAPTYGPRQVHVTRVPEI
jgi:hypothetical protein